MDMHGGAVAQAGDLQIRLFQLDCCVLVKNIPAGTSWGRSPRQSGSATAPCLVLAAAADLAACCTLIF